MFSWLGNTEVDLIDKLCKKICTNNTKDGELKQLSVLFKARFVKRLGRILYPLPYLRPHTRTIEIKIGWIDKIPVARHSHFTQATELGDAVFFAFDEVINPITGLSASFDARALIVQAKIADSYAQLKNPTVPITSARNKNSTERELYLLEGWPKFDLFKTGKSDATKPYRTSIELNPVGTPLPLPYGWYIAAPKGKKMKHSLQMAWPSWWMAAPAINKYPCNITFGSLLVSFFTGAPNGNLPHHLEVGKKTAWNYRSGLPAGASDWDNLCSDIYQILLENSPPQSLFTKKKEDKRIVTILKRISSFERSFWETSKVSKSERLYYYNKLIDYDFIPPKGSISGKIPVFIVKTTQISPDKGAD